MCCIATLIVSGGTISAAEPRPSHLNYTILGKMCWSPNRSSIVYQNWKGIEYVAFLSIQWAHFILWYLPLKIMVSILSLCASGGSCWRLSETSWVQQVCRQGQQLKGEGSWLRLRLLSALVWNDNAICCHPWFFPYSRHELVFIKIKQK